MEWLRSLGESQLQWGYIVITAILLGLIWFLGRNRLAEDSDNLINILDWFELRGLGTLFHILVLLGAMGLAWIGWRLPAEIESFASGERGMLSDPFPLTQLFIARVAQIFGAICYALIALRSMRYVVPIMAILIALFLGLLAYQYLTFAI